jgi:histidine triad (HIT) family protein
MAACIFCEIAAGRVPAQILHRDDLVTAFADTNPQAPTHILVIPNEHIASAAEVGEAGGALLGRVFAVARDLAEREGVLDSGYRLVTNVGRDAGQSVAHLHFHLLGGRRFRWPPG